MPNDLLAAEQYVDVEQDYTKSCAVPYTRKAHPDSYRPDLPLASKIQWKGSIAVGYAWPLTKKERAVLDARPLTFTRRDS